MHSVWWIAIIIIVVGNTVESFIIPVAPTGLLPPPPLLIQCIPQRHVGHHNGSRISTLLSSTSQQNTIEEKENPTTKTRRKNRSWEESFELLVSYKERYGNCNVPQRYKDDPRLGNWVNNQRKTNDRLSDERIAKLDDLGFLWSNELYETRRKNRSWEESFQLLVSYKEKHGNCNVPQKYKNDSRLGIWVNNQRQRKDRLSDERIAKLNDLGFSWLTFRTWEESYQLLVSYKEKHGNCNVPAIYKDDPRLGNWVNTQRRTKDKLSHERIAKLDSLGLSWSISDEQWNEMFENLKEYKTKYGNCNVPKNYKEDCRLGSWVNNQRHLKDSLSDDRFAKLDAMGFLWSVSGEKWNEMFKKLKEYKTKHGHCNVPQKYKNDLRLGLWVRDQRQRKDKLSDERIVKLNDLGFSWSEKQRAWEESYQLLVSYKEQHGNCNVPQNYTDDRRLGTWVNNQRLNKEKLSEDRIAKLEDVGFSWST